jgi:hypothetical protein
MILLLLLVPQDLHRSYRYIVFTVEICHKLIDHAYHAALRSCASCSFIENNG